MPQPIDLQTELGRITAAERIQQISDRASLAGQQRTAAEIQEQRIQVETQVQQTHAQSGQVEEELKRRNPFAGRRRRRAHEQDAEETPASLRGLVAEPEPHQFDVTI
jgi:hypothetical protein